MPRELTQKHLCWLARSVEVHIWTDVAEFHRFICGQFGIQRGASLESQCLVTMDEVTRSLPKKPRAVTTSRSECTAFSSNTERQSSQRASTPRNCPAFPVAPYRWQYTVLNPSKLFNSWTTF